MMEGVVGVCLAQGVGGLVIEARQIGEHLSLEVEWL